MAITNATKFLLLTISPKQGAGRYLNLDPIRFNEFFLIVSSQNGYLGKVGKECFTLGPFS